MEESENGHTKVSDSAYSNSCNSQSQHSGSSRSRHSNSSGSSGYGGHPSSSQSAIADFSVPKRKDKEFKKKKNPKTEVETVTSVSTNTPMISTPILETPDAEVTAPISGAQDTPNLVVPNKTEAINSGVSKDLRNGVCGPEATGTKPVVDIVQLEQEESDSPQMIMLKTSILSQITNSSNKKQSVSFEEKNPTQNWNKASFADVVVENCHHILKDITSSSGKNLNEYPLQREFSAMVSMLDGVILYTTPNIKDVLGYPRDMWMGRSFIDLVHPEDRSTFASYITSWVALPHEQNKFCTEPKWSPGFLFCRLRQYRGLKGSSGSFGVTERSLTYKPFQLHLALKDVGKGTQLLVTACLVESAFLKRAEENPTSVFATRHDSNTKITHIDPDAVSFLGFLPHEMLGKSFLDFCHPEDLKEIHKVYEQIMRFENNVTNENPFRLCVQNGGHILVKTEWSGFINPWTHLLEGVTGLHKVVKAPLNPDVFAAANNEEIYPISEEVLQEAKGIREKILNLLTKNVEMPDDVKCDITTRCKTITSEVHNAILVAMTKSSIKVDVTQGQNLSEQDSVMLGEISPHHDYYDSKSSTETPPSYNQLNYNDNIQRFFDSKPKMAPSLSDESGEGKQDLSRSTDEEGKRPQVVSSSSQGSRKCCSPPHCSLGSGSSDRNSNTPTSTGSYKPPQLTEALLCRHNEDMEKWMVQRHREQRNKTDSKSKKYTHIHEKQTQQESALCHGTKRSGSNSWEGEPYKASKHTHNSVQQTHPGECCNNKLKPQPTENVGIGVTTQTPGINLWPPFSVTLTPICTTQTCSSSGNYCMLGCCTGSNGRHVRIPQHVPPSPQLGGMIPFYYVPTAHASLAAHPPPLVPVRSAMVPPQEHPGPPINRAEMPFSQQQVPYVAGMIYHPMVSPLVYPLVGPTTEPAVVEQHHVSLSQQHLHGLGLQTYAETEHPVQDHHSYALKNPSRNHTSDGTVVTPGQTASTILNGKMQRPASQATSVKAEPGSSVASASVKRGMSESSKKEGYHTSGETEEECEQTDGCQEGESRSSSFYFRRTSTSCSDDISKGTDLTTNQKQDSDNSNTEDMVWERSENQEASEIPKPKLKPPPWLEGVVVNEDLVLHYKLENRNLDSVLKHDLNRLQYVSQSQVVNEQLSNLYSELDLMGLGCDLKLEEGEFSWGSTSSSSGGEGDQHESGSKKKQKNVKHVRLGRENDPPAPPCQSAQA